MQPTVHKKEYGMEFPWPIAHLLTRNEIVSHILSLATNPDSRVVFKCIRRKDENSKTSIVQKFFLASIASSFKQVDLSHELSRATNPDSGSF